MMTPLLAFAQDRDVAPKPAVVGSIMLAEG